MPKPPVTPEVKAKHERSVRKYPYLNLSEGEFVITTVRRHPIGLVIPMALGSFMIALLIVVASNYAAISASMGLQGPIGDPAVVSVPLYLFSLLVALGMFVVYYVYVSNRFFLTNESVIQLIQVTLFSRHEQTVSLINIEDASFTQTNIIQEVFNYGTIRLSTEGEHTTYLFTYVSSPKALIDLVNNAIECFKAGKPYIDPTDD